MISGTVFPFVSIRLPTLDSDIIKIECLDSEQEIIFVASTLENNCENERVSISRFLYRRQHLRSVGNRCHGDVRRFICHLCKKKCFFYIGKTK